MHRYASWARFSLVYLVLSFVLRIVIWSLYGIDAGVGGFDLISALSLGIINDSIVLVYLLSIFQIYFLLVPDRFYRAPKHKYILGTLVYLVFFGLLYLQIVEVCFFDEFNSRFNLVAVDYLMYPTEVLVNLWESYPIVWVLIGTAIVTYFLARWFWRFMQAGMDHQLAFSTRLKVAGVHLALIILCANVFSTTSFSLFQNRVTNQIAANGISSFFEALRTDELDYHAFYRTLPSEVAFKIIRAHLSKAGGKLTSDNPLDIDRSFSATTQKKLNLIIISEESLGAGYVGAYGDTRGMTPNFDALAPKGLLFKNAYATGTRTVRGLEAISSSFPPIPSESILKRPGNEHVTTAGVVLRQAGYHASFLYGGFGMFDNMNYFFGQNGFDLSDRADIEQVTFANIWGVCDQDLFRHAMGYYDRVSKDGKPFFSIIMTTSNHKPYTFPAGIPGIPERGTRHDGVRYADYAIGEFFREAPKHAWFDDTIVVVVADHDARVYGKALIPIERYRIPMLVLSPKHIEPRVFEQPVSQIDLVPTLMGMLGIEYTAPFYGANVLDPSVEQPRPILISHNHDVAMLTADRLTVLGLNREVSSYQIDRSDFATTRVFKQTKIENDAQSVDLLTAYLQTAYELFKAKNFH